MFFKKYYRSRLLVISTCSLLVLGFLIFSGLYQFLLTYSYSSYYRHYGPSEPLSVLVRQIEEGSTPYVLPFNKYNYDYIHINKQKCDNAESIRLLFVVKSAEEHFYRRQVIRQTWGYEQRFSDVNIRTIFLLGKRSDEPYLQTRVDKENKQFKDIIQGNFIDTYYNNTVKLMMGLDFVFHNCHNTKFFFFVDDDYYVSTRNVLRFLRDPKHYPQYLENYGVSAANEYQENLWAGHLFESSYPKRFIFSKWYVSLEEYPYSRYPPYLTAGAFVLSWRTLQTMYYASIYTKFFRFDDVFLGMCAKKANINPFHHAEFIFLRRPYSLEGYKYAIASHGFQDADEMQKIWEEQRSVGSA